MNPALAKVLDVLRTFWKIGNSVLRIAILLVVLWPFVVTAVAMAGIPTLTLLLGLLPLFAFVVALASFPLIPTAIAVFPQGRTVLKVLTLITVLEMCINLALYWIPVQNAPELLIPLMVLFVAYVMLSVVTGISVEKAIRFARRLKPLFVLIMVIIIIIMFFGGTANARKWIGATWHRAVSLYEERAAQKEAALKAEEERKAVAEKTRQDEAARLEALNDANERAETAERALDVARQREEARIAELKRLRGSGQTGDSTHPPSAHVDASGTVHFSGVPTGKVQSGRGDTLYYRRDSSGALVITNAPTEHLQSQSAPQPTAPPAPALPQEPDLHEEAMSLPLCDGAKDGKVVDLTDTARNILKDPRRAHLEGDRFELRVEPDCYSVLYKAPVYWVNTYVFTHSKCAPVRTFYPNRTYNRILVENVVTEPNSWYPGVRDDFGRRERIQAIQLGDKLFRVSAKCGWVTLSETDPAK
ncbi:MAG: hypothetical protein A3B30_03875 [Candidatus Komeilibacteria bacterium RIFCSPLOWO2_01_FULL_52_15]|uniref:Uncharacterized protein n=2 Tax=Candidatus Komeiliibacteriota TaxID=1817908 RepID=A0A1G2BTC6_9BACT|nr:MAG: hypothetical protein A2677_03305 [Candidatus Komeilibacteria bacterium RIFCSPHIGHO2_01_FULL_52_14]OGY91487.1 MAG: hypothetical protein A3B30_03875 [Candidatus Komeilibacteria bacterium RIFCSPLOWO2_01_FULL_52_15]